MENENLENELENLISEKFLMLMIAENGSYSWIASKEVSEEQKDVLSRVHAVLDDPSYVLLFVMYIEMILINIGIKIKKLFR
tara:strand:- start:528 stop:773 length:246 start_codon:yes stop_codon:yes gene_type:complete